MISEQQEDFRDLSTTFESTTYESTLFTKQPTILISKIINIGDPCPE